MKKAIPTPAIPTIHERRRNKMTPRIFCTVGRYTPMIVPRLAFFFFLDFPPFPSAMLGEVASTGRREERREAIRGRDLSSSWKGAGQGAGQENTIIKQPW